MRNEKVVLAIYVSILLAISIAATILVPKLLTFTGFTYAEYRAALYNNFTLIEDYTYHIGERGKSMLYRHWEAPLYPASISFIDSEPHILLLYVECPRDSIPYVKDNEGAVYILFDETSRTIDRQLTEALTAIIGEKAYNNEVGCFFPSEIPLGVYNAKFVFQLNPPIYIDEEYAYVNLKLADEHVAYQYVELRLHGFNPVKLYVHVPEYSLESKEEITAITGTSPQNTLLEVEFVAPRDKLNAPLIYTIPVDHVLAEADKANMQYSIRYNAVKALCYAFTLVLVAFPALLVVRYYLIGREKEFTVPEYLSYTPNPVRKPWQVNLLFHRDAIDMSEDAFYATILDFARRGIIEVKDVGKDDVVLEVKRDVDSGSLDIYESRVLEFLKEFSTNNVFSFKEFSERVKNEVGRSISNARHYRVKLDGLFKTFREAYDYAKQFIEPRKPASALVITLTLLVAIGLLALLPKGSEYYVYPSATAVFAFILPVEMIIAYTMPSYVFGEWKKDFHKEKLEWSAFRNLLKELAKLDKYTPQDLVIWKEWLVYATALGIADKVVEAMEKLKVPAPREAYIPIVARPIMMRTMYTVHAATGQSRKGARSSGFGAGRGFGGGGGGVR